MPAKYKLRYLPAAEKDLLSILEWIAKDSPDHAISFINKLDKRISILETFPKTGRIPRHPKLSESGYRILVIESYIAFYKIVGHTIQVHRVIRGSRNLDMIIF